MSITSAIGNTPLVKVVSSEGNCLDVNIYAKLEGCNPGGSIKDRTALYMIRDIEANTSLSQETDILEATSGNTGIAIAMICAVKGMKAVLCMPECVSVERRRILEALGAKLIITPGARKTDGAIEEVHRLIGLYPQKYHHLDQFNNPANAQAHYETTGPEIWSQTEGNVDCLVCGIGTSGTLMGVSRYLKEKNPDIKVFGVQPHKEHNMQGLKNLTISKTPGIYQPACIDDMLYIDDETAFEQTRNLALKSGIFVGMSSGLAFAASLKIAKMKRFSNIVTVFPDRGDRYLSTNLFTSYCAKCPP